ncbi:ATP-dependent Clp protease proteolytic subunit [Dysgonomonas termitidis]|uniref:ATP-dependent Clp protease proteolytic subunit n=1 Tax=Dysgonomonas termitidis TaxID=1516126 RepID=A0ABV9KTT5_9BACT
MAKDRTLEIMGDIGSYGFSMGYVKYLMNELGEGPITVKTTSYGGDVNHALKIKDLFASHGDVTLEYVGMNASASTLIGHGAKKTIIHEDSLYLIHKPLLWVDAWGSMNEDDIDQAIADLVAQKKDAETVTLVLARDYVNSRGMELKKVMELMKEARWLSAREAVDLGLVDELLPTKNKKPVISNHQVAIMKANGLPVPEATITDDNEDLSWMDKAKQFFSPKNKNEMNKTFSNLNKALNIEGFEAADDKVTLTVAQLTALNQKLGELEQAAGDATTAKESAESAKDTAETALNELTGALDGIDTTVKAAADGTAKVTAIKAILARRPGAKPESPQGNGGDGKEKEDDDVDWEAIDKLPHNRAADVY